MQTDIQSPSELEAQLNHVGGQLAAHHGPGSAAPLLEELIDIAAELRVPTRQRRDDSHVFLEAPHKISEATWTQCGGILYALSHERGLDCAPIAAAVAQRIARLARTRH